MPPEEDVDACARDWYLRAGNKGQKLSAAVAPDDEETLAATLLREIELIVKYRQNDAIHDGFG